METTAESIELVDEATVGNLTKAALFAALMGAFAYVAFPYPLSPAPVTLQVLGVLLAGALLGPAWGAFSLVLYVLAGAMGAPVFSLGAAGVGPLVSEQGGYILAFPVAAAVVGFIIHGGFSLRDHRAVTLARLLVAMAAGIVIIYAGGVVGMIIVLELGPVDAIILGALVFVPAEAAKVAAALGVLRSDRLAAA